MPYLALTALVLYFALAFGWRSWRQWRRTGSTGFRGISGAVGSAEWLGGVLFVVAIAASLFAPLMEIAGLVTPWAMLTKSAVHAAGIALAVLGMIGTLWSQMAMGDAWRIGVDREERTELVARGPFRHVRNPIFTSMVVGLGGIALLTPNLLAAVALAALVAALQLQVRLVEEPYLIATHGAGYRRYAARAGRFMPAMGRLQEG
jgi:protein-S-isoprenylcysteine O-methyltransferase Ste14